MESSAYYMYFFSCEFHLLETKYPDFPFFAFNQTIPFSTIAFAKQSLVW